jgi:hypothetical protein
MDTPALKPSRGYYVLAPIVFVSGWGLLAVFLFVGLSGLGNRLQRVVAPGQSDLALNAPGDYTIYYEHRSVVGNRVYFTDENLSGLECELGSKATGAIVPLSASSTNSTYSIGSYEGKSLFEFHLQQPGTYQLTTGYADARAGPEVVLAVGQGIFTKIVLAVFGGVASLFACLALAVAIAVVTFIKRTKARKQLASREGTS